MPKKRKGNKKTRSQLGASRARPIVKPKSIAELIAKNLPTIEGEARRQGTLITYLRAKLGAEFAPHLGGAQQRDGALILLTESAGWATRLRYALVEIYPEICREKPAIREIVVRVMPRARG